MEGGAAAAYLHSYMTTATSDRRDATTVTAAVTAAAAVATTARAQWGLAELHRQQVWEEELRQQAAADTGTLVQSARNTPRTG
jgi:hypothetical protein